jgi:flagellar biosynthesis protein FliP
MIAMLAVSALLAGLVVLAGMGARSLQRRMPRVHRAGQRLEVLERVALAPRQGLALVRIGERHVLVSMGDGGVRSVLELTDAESLALTAEQEAASNAPALPDGARRVLGIVRDIAAGPGRAARHAATRTAVGALLLAAAIATPAAPATADTRTDAAATVVVDAAAAELAELDDAVILAQVAPLRGAAQGARPGAASATGALPKLDLRLGDGEASDLRISGTVGSVIMIGLLALLPAMLLLMTSFTRILIVLHFLRQALGTQTAPPGQLLAALSLMLTGFVMAPTLSAAHSQAFQPWMDGTITEGEMLTRGVGPFREFMLAQTPEKDIVRFLEMSGAPAPETAEEIPLPVLVSAFAVSELRAAFQMGFAIFLPFVVIDLVVSAVLTSMGMFMLPPTMIALPCKLLLFVLADGWALTVQSLVASFR